ncbi:hypothetical protein AAVH_24984 [Aphelenchoides avenae]|nr:hypothetical protein AAVH_24984 [Aphelenchus avenae]
MKPTQKDASKKQKEEGAGAKAERTDVSGKDKGCRRLSTVYWRHSGWQDRRGVKNVIVGAYNKSTKLEKDFDTEDEAAKYFVELLRDAVVEGMDVGYECWFGANIVIVRILAAVVEIRHLHLLYENTLMPDDDKLDHYCDRIAPLFWSVPKLTAQCLHGDDTPGAPLSQFCRRNVRMFKKDENGKKTRYCWHVLRTSFIKFLLPMPI